jgi:hypothetical protein
MADVGLTIVEGVASGATAYKEPSKRNIGLLGQFVRGAAFSPTKITNMEDFNTIFGGQSASFFGPAIVKSIFDEAGNAPVTLYLARVVGSGSVVANGSGNLSGSATMEVNAGYKGKDDPGAWANGIVVSLYSFSSRVKDMFTLTVQYGDNQEQYNYGTLAEIQNAVNKVSKYITIEFSSEIETLVFKSITGTVTASTSSNDVTGEGTKFLTDLSVGSVLYDTNKKLVGTVSAITSDTKLTLASKAITAVSSTTITKRDDKVYSATLAGGSDGEVLESDFYPVESTADPKGLACFDGYDVQIIACTEFHSLTMAKVLNEYLKDKKNPVGVINLPLNADEGTAELYAMELQTNQTSFLAGAYMGWCKVPDKDGNGILIPAIGPILGAAFIRTPYLQGDFIHVPPGGIDSLFNNVLEVIPPRLSQSSMNKLVQQFSCNIIQYVENTGYYVGSSRTYSTNNLYSSIHVRMQTSYYLRALNSKMRFLEQKPNTPELKREALVELNQFFKTEYDNGALERSINFDQAYQGICDRSNNPSTQDRKLLNIDVLWIPTECTESVRISLQRNDGILTSIETEA